MKRPAVRKNLLSTAFAIAAFAVPNLVRAFAQSLSRYGSPLPRSHEAEGSQRCGFWAPPTIGHSPIAAAALCCPRRGHLQADQSTWIAMCSNPVISICLLRNIR